MIVGQQVCKTYQTTSQKGSFYRSKGTLLRAERDRFAT